MSTKPCCCTGSVPDGKRRKSTMPTAGLMVLWGIERLMAR
ncbi:hypothetical protein CUS_7603 [Ruminococcus albus 8]|uniref:Uncharacterized protein n=1 Tax=Ruminococcus albus 8 TaxID=246199 RepID=E9SH75_RUMAL|nr:hypothetical protein CUS_7603 [Ruminococcus albus 8]